VTNVRRALSDRAIRTARAAGLPKFIYAPANNTVERSNGTIFFVGSEPASAKVTRTRYVYGRKCWNLDTPYVTVQNLSQVVRIAESLII